MAYDNMLICDNILIYDNMLIYLFKRYELLKMKGRYDYEHRHKNKMFAFRE